MPSSVRGRVKSRRHHLYPVLRTGEASTLQYRYVLDEKSNSGGLRQLSAIERYSCKMFEEAFRSQFQCRSSPSELLHCVRRLRAHIHSDNLKEIRLLGCRTAPEGA